MKILTNSWQKDIYFILFAQISKQKTTNLNTTNRIQPVPGKIKYGSAVQVPHQSKCVKKMMMTAEYVQQVTQSWCIHVGLRQRHDTVCDCLQHRWTSEEWGLSSQMILA